MEKLAHVKVAGVENLVTVPATSDEKPEIPQSYEKKWQEIASLAARITGVPAGLVMRLGERDIEVFVRSETEGNPYDSKAKDELGLGLYCETVVGRREPLMVPDALADIEWRANPDVDRDMVAYLGVPIRWPDGEVFGTFCVLDNQEHRYSDDERALLERFAELIERDLSTLVQTSYLVTRAELRNREIRHRIKNQFNLLISYIDLQGLLDSEERDPELLGSKIKSRIQMLSKVHEQLSLVEPGAQIPLLEHLRELTVAMVSGSGREVSVIVHSDEVIVEEEKLVTLGLLLNELVANSLKHAFSEQPNPEITVELRRSQGRLALTYSDNGAGFRDPPESSGGIGREIIHAFVAQIDGSYAEKGAGGYTFRLEIPEE